MRKYIFSLLLLSAYLPGFCQTQKGSTLLETSVLISSSSSTNDAFDIEERGYGLSFSFGKFVTNGFAIGASVAYDLEKYSYMSAGGSNYNFDNKQSSLSGGVFAQVFLLPPEERFNVSVGGIFAMGKINAEQSYSSNTGLPTLTSEDKYTRYVARMGPVYFLNPHVSINLLGQYSITNYNVSETKQSTLAMVIGMQVFLYKTKVPKQTKTGL